jgi:hypothetical protein
MEFIVELLPDVPKNADFKKPNFLYICIHEKNPYARDGLSVLGNNAGNSRRGKTTDFAKAILKAVRNLWLEFFSDQYNDRY